MGGHEHKESGVLYYSEPFVGSREVDEPDEEDEPTVELRPLPPRQEMISRERFAEAINEIAGLRNAASKRASQVICNDALKAETAAYNRALAILGKLR
jgi:hypothetical protein